jgi:DNA-binding transcriptional regulator YbjK
MKRPITPGPKRVVGSRARGLKNVVPFGAEADRAARRGDKASTLSLMQKSRTKLLADMEQLNQLHNGEKNTTRRKQLMRQMRVVNNRLLELDYHLE